MKNALPPTYFLLTLVAMTLLHVLWPIARCWHFPLSLTGLIPLGLGSFLNVLTDREFKRHQTTVKPFEKPSALLVTFPFSFTRNPMYLGLALMLLGVALLLGTVSPLVPAVSFPLLVDRLFIRAEEQMLAASFGEDWDEYRGRVRRWL